MTKLTAGKIGAMKMCLDCGRPFEGDRERGRPNVCGRCKGKRAKAPNRRAYSDSGYLAIPLVGACACCGRTDDLTRDHVIPLVLVNNADISTMVVILLCRRCNSSKGDTGACRLDHS